MRVLDSIVRGKLEGVPVSALLGGARRDRAGHPDHGRHQLRLDAGRRDGGGSCDGAVEAVLGRGADFAALAGKERAAPLERLFADVGFIAYAKTVPVVDGAIDVPDRPGLGADPEHELIERFRA